MPRDEQGLSGEGNKIEYLESSGTKIILNGLLYSCCALKKEKQ